MFFTFKEEKRMSKFGVKEVCDVTFIDLKTGVPVLRLDTLKMTNIENVAQSSSARGGKGNSKLLTWDFDRDATMQVQDALMSETSIGMLTGNPVVKGIKDIYKFQGVTVKDATADKNINLDKDPVTGSVQVLHNGQPLTVTTDYTVSTTSPYKVTISKTIAVGDRIEVFYLFKSDANANTIKISSDAFPGYYKVVGDTVVRNASTGVDEPFQIVIHKAKLQPGFTLNFQADGDPTVFDMNMEVMRADGSTSMIEMIKY